MTVLVKLLISFTRRVTSDIKYHMTLNTIFSVAFFAISSIAVQDINQVDDHLILIIIQTPSGTSIIIFDVGNENITNFKVVYNVILI